MVGDVVEYEVCEVSCGRLYANSIVAAVRMLDAIMRVYSSSIGPRIAAGNPQTMVSITAPGIRVRAQEELRV